MGVATSDAIAEKLMADGLAPDMPIAVIENAARPTMRVLRGALAGLGALVEEHKVKSPALIVIGEVVRLRAGLDWLSALTGKTLDPDPLGNREAARQTA